jgi:hypothetical protein
MGIRKVIVIGAGDSFNEEFMNSLLKYDGKDFAIFSSDRTLKKVLESGVTPDKFEMFTCIQENLINEELGIDFFPKFFDDKIVRKYANKISVFTSHTFTRIEELREIGFKERIDFIRHGKSGRVLSDSPTIKTCGNNVMSMIGMARNYKIPYISTIGFQMDNTGSYKEFNCNVNNELELTIKQLFQDYLDYGEVIYNLTDKGLIHGKGVRTITLKEFMKIAH